MDSTSPPSYTINEVHLGEGPEHRGGEPGKITNVNLYANRAEITRTYRLKVIPGQNKVTIHGLPTALERDSLRVEGRGKATLQDVTVSQSVPPAIPTTSAEIEALEEKKSHLALSLQRCVKAISGLDKYLDTLAVSQLVDKAKGYTPVLPVLDDYYAASEKYDQKATALKSEIKELDKAIQDERARLKDSVAFNPACLNKAIIGVFADVEGDAELILKYAVFGPSWTPQYDIRAATNAKENSVEIVYKASIQQKTGEDWNDVPVTLETTSPSFNLALPVVHPWKLTPYKPPVRAASSSTAEKEKKSRGSQKSKPIARFLSLEAASSSEDEEESDDDMGFGLFDGDEPPVMEKAGAAVTALGGAEMNASFRIPGVVSVVSGDAAKSFTIVTLQPAAKLAWMAAPGVDTRVHLTANVKNTSEYILLAGACNVYVDGTFISKSTLPLVSPQETFKCPLGLDPSIRFEYHPLSTKRSTSGPLSLSKTATTIYTQRISVHNSKATMKVEGLKIISRVPVSEDSQIQVKLHEPKGLTQSTKEVKVADGVVAGWFVEDNQDEDNGANVASKASVMTGSSTGRPDSSQDPLGKDGRVQWLCNIDPQKRLELTLKWEVAHPKDHTVIGL